MKSLLISQVVQAADQTARSAAKQSAGNPPSEKSARANEGKPAAEAESQQAATTETPWYAEMLDSGAMGYMIAGGIFMWPILILGILAAGVIIERFRSLKMLGTNTEVLRGQVLELLNADRVEEALELCGNKQGPVPAILSTGLRKFLVLKRLNYDAGRIEEQVVKSMDDYGVHIVAALERHLPILATVASAAPMLGFLGTVQGMVVSFDDIVRREGEASIVVLAAAGIKVALLTTVLGLVVGIPAFVAYNYFNSVINRFVLDVEESATDLIEAVTMQMAINEQHPTSANGSVLEAEAKVSA